MRDSGWPRDRPISTAVGPLRILLVLSCWTVGRHPVVGVYEVCSDPETGASLACQPDMFDVIWHPSFRVEVSPGNVTCGRPASTYRRLGDTSSTQNICDASSVSLQHEPTSMVDDDISSWWQSTNKPTGYTDFPVEVTLSFNKSFTLAGDLLVTFNSGRPDRVVLEKSTNHGQTWSTWQFYAKNCSSFGSELESSQAISTLNPTAVICTSQYAETSPAPPAGRKVLFSLDDRFLLFLGPNEVDFRTFYTALDTQMWDFLRFTDIRIRLLNPAGDGANDLDTLYYGISDIQAISWCDCNLHAAYCNYTETEILCDCQHNTTGKDCQTCLPLYNDRPWKRGSFVPYDTGTANECLKCECHDHAVSCLYNATYGRGVCQDCLHNTRGYHCELCALTYYPNVSLPLNDLNICIECDCDLLGVYNNSQVCAQVPTSSEILGQCLCRPLVAGRRCDQCVPGYFGLQDQLTLGVCTACDCDPDGTLGQNKTCQQTGGQCPCKNHTWGRRCQVCRDGFFSFPAGRQDMDCLPCDCDLAGSSGQVCDKVTGQCDCRWNVTGRRCKQAPAGTFVPMIDAWTLEPSSGQCNVTSDLYSPLTPFDGPGFARCDLRGSSNISVVVDVVLVPGQQLDLKWPYLPALRYSSNLSDVWVTLHLRVSGNTTRDLSRLTDRLGQDVTSPCPLTAGLTDDVTLSLPAGQTSTLSWSSGLILDIRCQYSLTLELSRARSNNSTIAQTPSARRRRETSARIKRDTSSEDRGSLFMLDSVLLLPAFTSVDATKGFRVYTMSENRTATLETYRICLQETTNLLSRLHLMETSSSCTDLFFSLGLELNNGTQACDCDPVGANSSLQLSCQSLGGQCSCLPGTSGRACNRCVPGYFNLSTTGCTPCSCHPQGSQSGVCELTTGQCPCQPNVALLSPSSAQNGPVNGSCSSCQRGYFGLLGGRGCLACSCHPTGSLDPQCDQSGQCPCRDSVTGLKCDSCRDGFFGLGPTGCSACDCSLAGSTAQTCNQTSGACSCKSRVEGTKCGDCRAGYFNLATHNPDGCQPCFCFGHGTNCSSASGFVAKRLEVTTPNQTLVSGPLMGDLHSSYGLNLSLTISTESGLDLSNETLVAISGHGDTVYHQARPGTVSGPELNYSVPLWERDWVRLAENTSLTALDFLKILANVTEVRLVSSVKGQMVHVTYISLQSAEEMAGVLNSESGGTTFETVGFVEQCACLLSDHVAGLSCQTCATGYRRPHPTLSSAYDACLPCDCNNRTVSQPPQCLQDSGLCLNCRNGTTGDSCEKCASFVVGAECDRCTENYWELGAHGCTACNCSSPASLNGTCDQVTGQCPCSDHVTGRSCDQCQENFYGLSGSGCRECDVCYSSLIPAIVPLRQLTSNMTLSVSHLHQNTTTPTQINSFTARLSLANQTAEQLTSFVASAQKSAPELSSKIQSLNQTLESTRGRMQETLDLTTSLQTNLTTADLAVMFTQTRRAELVSAVQSTMSTLEISKNRTRLLAQVGDSLNSALVSLESLANSSTTDQQILAQLAALREVVSATQRLMADFYKNFLQALNVHQSNTRDLLLLESSLVKLLSRVANTQPSLLVTSNREMQDWVRTLAAQLAAVSNYSTDWLALAGSTSRVQSNLEYWQSQLSEASNLSSPSHLKALQSRVQLDSMTNKTSQPSQAAASLLWSSLDSQHRSAIIQNETRLLLASAGDILAAASNFSAGVREIQQTANRSVVGWSPLSVRNQELTETGDNLRQNLTVLAQDASTAVVVSLQAWGLARDTHLPLDSLVNRSHQLQLSLESTSDQTDQYQEQAVSMSGSLSTGLALCDSLNMSVSHLRHKVASSQLAVSAASLEVANTSQVASKLLVGLRALDWLGATSVQGLTLDRQQLLGVVQELQARRTNRQAEIEAKLAVRDQLRARILAVQAILKQRT